MAHKRVRSSRFPGVYWRESTDPSRKHNGRPDRCFDYCIRVSGKLKWVNVGWLSEGFSEQKAANLRREALMRLAHGGLEEEPQIVCSTLGAAIEAYLHWMEHEGKYFLAEKSRYITHIQSGFGNQPLEALNPNQVAELKARLITTGSVATAKKVLSLCRAAVNHAIRTQVWAGVNPFGGDRISMPRPQDRGERFLSPDEARALLQELGKRSPQLHDMAWLSLKTGLRSTEIFRLKGGDVDIQGGVLWVTEKGKARRPVRVGKDVLETLERYGRAPEEYIFQGRNGKKLKEISDTFTRACVAVGLTQIQKDGKQDSRKKMWFHVLRHTFASWLAQSGQVTLQELRDLMRHKTVAMTERYAHLIPEKSASKTALIGEILNKG